ncbi:MAG: class I SAM-dependent methyltransferase [Candidatus Woesearchaeota archaeon]
MKYNKYQREYYGRVEHKKFSNAKRIAVNAVMKSHIVSAYYCNLLKILDSLPKNSKVLDIGCSHGGFLNFVSNIRPDLKLYGTDISDVSKLLPKKIHFIQADIVNDELKEKGFDFIVSIHLIEHLDPGDVQAVFNKAYGLLNKNGHCLFLAPRLSQRFYDDPTHIRPYNKGSLTRLFSMAGFKAIKAYNRCELNFPFSLFKPMKLAFGFARK